MSPFYVVGFYRFTPITNRESLREAIRAQFETLQIKGSIYLAKEGINGGLAGTHDSLRSFLNWLQTDERFKGIRVQWSESENMPFYRAKVRLKNEIVTMGVPDVDPNRTVGTYVKPQDWNALLEQQDVLLIDTRNDYEYRLGHFHKAINPDTPSFRAFPAYIREQSDIDKTRPVAMYCTGGIRCEKATSYLLENGFTNVFHLEGGILNYLESVPETDSLWKGDCFVFDQRTALGHGLETSSASVCNACWEPVTEEERDSPEYIAGESCPRCAREKTESQRSRYRERQRQIAIAKERSEKHMGRVLARNLETSE
jgi:UPF0176 protein